MAPGKLPPGLGLSLQPERGKPGAGGNADELVAEMSCSHLVKRQGILMKHWGLLKETCSNLRIFLIASSQSTCRSGTAVLTEGVFWGMRPPYRHICPSSWHSVKNLRKGQTSVPSARFAVMEKAMAMSSWT